MSRIASPYNFRSPIPQIPEENSESSLSLMQTPNKSQNMSMISKNLLPEISKLKNTSLLILNISHLVRTLKTHHKRDCFKIFLKNTQKNKNFAFLFTKLNYLYQKKIFIAWEKLVYEKKNLSKKRLFFNDESFGQEFFCDNIKKFIKFYNDFDLFSQIKPISCKNFKDLQKLRTGLSNLCHYNEKSIINLKFISFYKIFSEALKKLTDEEILGTRDFSRFSIILQTNINQKHTKSCLLSTPNRGRNINSPISVHLLSQNILKVGEISENDLSSYYNSSINISPDERIRKFQRKLQNLNLILNKKLPSLKSKHLHKFLQYEQAFCNVFRVLEVLIKRLQNGFFQKMMRIIHGRNKKFEILKNLFQIYKKFKEISKSKCFNKWKGNRILTVFKEINKEKIIFNKKNYGLIIFKIFEKNLKKFKKISFEKIKKNVDFFKKIKYFNNILRILIRGKLNNSFLRILFLRKNVNNLCFLLKNLMTNSILMKKNIGLIKIRAFLQLKIKQKLKFTNIFNKINQKKDLLNIFAFKKIYLQFIKSLEMNRNALLRITSDKKIKKIAYFLILSNLNKIINRKKLIFLSKIIKKSDFLLKRIEIFSEIISKNLKLINFRSKNLGFNQLVTSNQRNAFKNQRIFMKFLSILKKVSLIKLNRAYSILKRNWEIGLFEFLITKELIQKENSERNLYIENLIHKLKRNKSSFSDRNSKKNSHKKEKSFNIVNINNNEKIGQNLINSQELQNSGIIGKEIDKKVKNSNNFKKQNEIIKEFKKNNVVDNEKSENSTKFNEKSDENNKIDRNKLKDNLKHNKTNSNKKNLKNDLYDSSEENTNINDIKSEEKSENFSNKNKFQYNDEYNNKEIILENFNHYQELKNDSNENEIEEEKSLKQNKNNIKNEKSNEENDHFEINNKNIRNKSKDKKSLKNSSPERNSVKREKKNSHEKTNINTKDLNNSSPYESGNEENIKNNTKKKELNNEKLEKNENSSSSVIENKSPKINEYSIKKLDKNLNNKEENNEELLNKSIKNQNEFQYENTRILSKEKKLLKNSKTLENEKIIKKNNYSNDQMENYEPFNNLKDIKKNIVLVNNFEKQKDLDCNEEKIEKSELKQKNEDIPKKLNANKLENSNVTNLIPENSNKKSDRLNVSNEYFLNNNKDSKKSSNKIEKLDNIIKVEDFIDQNISKNKKNYIQPLDVDSHSNENLIIEKKNHNQKFIYYKNNINNNEIIKNKEYLDENLENNLENPENTKKSNKIHNMDNKKSDFIEKNKKNKSNEDLEKNNYSLKNKENLKKTKNKELKKDDSDSQNDNYFNNEKKINCIMNNEENKIDSKINFIDSQENENLIKDSSREQEKISIKKDQNINEKNNLFSKKNKNTKNEENLVIKKAEKPELNSKISNIENKHKKEIIKKKTSEEEEIFTKDENNKDKEKNTKKNNLNLNENKQKSKICENLNQNVLIDLKKSIKNEKNYIDNKDNELTNNVKDHTILEKNSSNKDEINNNLKEIKIQNSDDNNIQSKNKTEIIYNNLNKKKTQEEENYNNSELSNSEKNILNKENKKKKKITEENNQNSKKIQNLNDNSFQNSEKSIQSNEKNSKSGEIEELDKNNSQNTQQYTYKDENFKKNNENFEKMNKKQSYNINEENLSNQKVNNSSYEKNLEKKNKNQEKEIKKFLYNPDYEENSNKELENENNLKDKESKEIKHKKLSESEKEEKLSENSNRKILENSSIKELENAKTKLNTLSKNQIDYEKEYDTDNIYMEKEKKLSKNPEKNNKNISIKKSNKISNTNIAENNIKSKEKLSEETKSSKNIFNSTKNNEDKNKQILEISKNQTFNDKLLKNRIDSENEENYNVNNSENEENSDFNEKNLKNPNEKAKNNNIPIKTSSGIFNKEFVDKNQEKPLYIKKINSEENHSENEEKLSEINIKNEKKLSENEENFKNPKNQKHQFENKKSEYSSSENLEKNKQQLNKTNGNKKNPLEISLKDSVDFNKNQFSTPKKNSFEYFQSLKTPTQRSNSNNSNQDYEENDSENKIKESEHSEINENSKNSQNNSILNEKNNENSDKNEDSNENSSLIEENQPEGFSENLDLDPLEKVRNEKLKKHLKNSNKNNDKIVINTEYPQPKSNIDEKIVEENSENEEERPRAVFESQKNNKKTESMLISQEMILSETLIDLPQNSKIITKAKNIDFNDKKSNKIEFYESIPINIPSENKNLGYQPLKNVKNLPNDKKRENPSIKISYESLYTKDLLFDEIIDNRFKSLSNRKPMNFNYYERKPQNNDSEETCDYCQEKYSINNSYIQNLCFNDSLNLPKKTLNTEDLNYPDKKLKAYILD